VAAVKTTNASGSAQPIARSEGQLCSAEALSALLSASDVMAAPQLRPKIR
jgi:hypothetical protein